MQVELAQPRGYCAGVTRAVDIVERALEVHGAPVYVYHEIIHNRHVVEDLAARGALCVHHIEDVPFGAVLVFSAHGVGNDVVERARQRRLRVIDATCPLVAKVHLQARRYVRAGRHLLIVGHRGHDEVVGTLGSVDDGAWVVASPEDVEKLPIAVDAPVAYVTQTTLSLDDTATVIEAIKARFSDLEGPGLDDICYATQNRQNAVRSLAAGIDVLLVVGSRNSSNSNRLSELGRQLGVPSHLVEDASEVDPTWIAPGARVGLTAGASASEGLVQGVVERLRTLGDVEVSEAPGLRETISFRLPAGLARSA
ncbi:MAG: 4-hydroxy-3-methylbut-2-enyl diphosphate reductase [Steroidobacteraceae bacterium]